MNTTLPNTAIIIFPSGAFGGAEKRFTNLYINLRELYPGKFHFIINPLMMQHIERVFGKINRQNIHIIKTKESHKNINAAKDDIYPRKYSDIIPDPVEVDKNTSLLRKFYWFYKNRKIQMNLFRQIEQIRMKENINVFIGVFAGGLPLMFYLEKPFCKVKVVFSDMDSWFSDVMADMKKLWYRKYFSFNYILEHAHKVDFLSPYIAQGIKKLGVSIPGDRISVSPCSFIDYSKCSAGSKTDFEFAFASRLEPDKNPLLYLEAAGEVLREYPSVKFHLLGEGSLVNEIKEFISLNNLGGSVNFAFHPNPPDIFSKTSVFVSLQSGTNYPSQSVLEAMACGNAVIASNTGDTPLFVNESNGILVELNKNSVSGAMKKLIAEKKLTRELGLNAKAFAEKNHTIERVTEYYTEMIKNIHEGGING